jgi:hypothetical protein
MQPFNNDKRDNHRFIGFFFNPQKRRVNMQRGLSNQWFGGVPRFSVFAGGPTTASAIGW